MTKRFYLNAIVNDMKLFQESLELYKLPNLSNYKFLVKTVTLKTKLHQKLTHSFTCVSVAIKFARVGQESDTGQTLKTLQFDQCSF